MSRIGCVQDVHSATGSHSEPLALKNSEKLLQFKYACRKKLQLAIPEQIYMVHRNNISLTSKCLHTNLA